MKKKLKLIAIMATATLALQSCVVVRTAEVVTKVAVVGAMAAVTVAALPVVLPVKAYQAVKQKRATSVHARYRPNPNNKRK